MKAKINIEIVDGTNSGAMPLTTWKSSDSTNEGYDVLQTGTYAAGATYQSARLSDLGTQSTGYVRYVVNAWLTDITDATGEKTAAGHEAAWKAAIKALDGKSGKEFTQTFTFAYDSNKTVSDGEELLPTEETKFYFVAQASGTAPTISHALEAAGNKAVDISALDLVDNYSEYNYNAGNTPAQPKLQIGYLFVRAEGSLRGHNNAESYIAPVKTTSAAKVTNNG